MQMCLVWSTIHNLNVKKKTMDIENNSSSSYWKKYLFGQFDLENK
jgi:hypothetical protein